MKRFYNIILIFVISASCLFSQDKGLLTLEKIFASGEFSARGVGQTQWIGDGDSYVKVERSASMPSGRDIVSYDAKTGKREILVPVEKLIPKGQTTPISMESYRITPEKDLMLIFNNSERVWRQNTRGDYWLLNLKTWDLFQIGIGLKPSTLMFATISPDKQKVAYVSQNNLYMEDLNSHKITQLTNDGSVTIINGTFDWVYEEELDLRNGFRWSPDSKKNSILAAGCVRRGRFQSNKLYRFNLFKSYSRSVSKSWYNKFGM